MVRLVLFDCLTLVDRYSLLTYVKQSKVQEGRPQAGPEYPSPKEIVR